MNLLKRIIRVVCRYYLKALCRLGIASNPASYLEKARWLLANAQYPDALSNYLKAGKLDTTNIESYAGATLCYLHMNAVEDALKTIQEANRKYGDLDGILSLLTKCYLRLERWQDIQESWEKWRASLGNAPSYYYYTATGDIWLELVKTESGLQELADAALKELLYQEDSSIGEKEHPVICSILFHHHEFNRPLYRTLLQKIQSFIDRRGINFEQQKTTATMALTFGFVDENLRKRLLAKFIASFDLFSHWSMVLVGSTLNVYWEETLKESAKNLPVVSELLLSQLSSPPDLTPDCLYRFIILANICCPETMPALMEHVSNLLDKHANLGSYKEDLAFIRQKYLGKPALRKMPDKATLKIAVCVSGQLRGYEEAFPTWDKIGLLEHDVTYIVHTWKDTGGGLPVPPKDERVLPPRFQGAFRAAWNKLGQEAMFSRYKNLFSLWRSRNGLVDKKTLQKFYNTEHVFLENDNAPPFNTFPNLQKMYYKIEKCHEIARSLNKDFDLIVRMRPDMKFLEKTDMNWPELYRTSLEKKTLFCEYSACSTYLFPNIGFCMPDQLAVAVPEVMDGYASAYSMSNATGHFQNLKHFPRNFIAHTNVAYATLYNGISVEAMPISCSLIQAYKPTEEEIKQAILKDVAGRNDAIDLALITSLN